MPSIHASSGRRMIRIRIAADRRPAGGSSNDGTNKRHACIICHSPELETRRAPTNRCDQYDALRRSTRTTPAELGACTNSSPPSAIATWVGPGATVLKNSRSPAATCAFVIGFPCLNWSTTARGSAIPYWLYTYWVKPLQSNPDGSAPPFLYGAPRRARAAPVIAY